MANNQMRKISLRDAENDKSSSLYVMNRTKIPGAINLSVRDAQGRPVATVIPNTFIPVDMSNFIPKKALLEEASFRRLVQGGVVIIINTEDALRAIDSNPKAQEEQRRIYAVNAELSDNSEEQETVEIGVREDTKSEKVVSENSVAPFALGVVERAKAGEDVADLISEISGKLYSLEVPSLQYIFNNVSSDELKSAVQEFMENM